MLETGRGSVEKRAYDRMPENVPVDFYYDKKIYEGIVTNLSRKGLHIIAELCPPFESNLKVVLILGDEVFNLPGKVKRSVKSDGSIGTIGVELSGPSKSYCDFLTTVEYYYRKK